MTEYFTKDGDDYKKVEDKLFTQAEVDTDIIPKRLDRERSKFADYDTLKEKAGKVDSITQEFTDKLSAADTEKQTLIKERDTAKLDIEKVKAIHEYNLPDELAEFVSGDTAEDIRTRAEKLSKGVTGGTITVDKKPKPADEDDGTKKVVKNLFGNKPD